MAIFYQRTETEKEIVIVYKYNLHFWVGFVVLIALGATLNLLFVFLAALLTVIYFIDLLKPSAEVKRAMRERAVSLSGSKLSLRNPAKAVITKKS